jgi:hypothetical protein
MVLYSEQLQTLLKDQLAKIVLATSQDISEVNSIVMNRLNAKFTAHEAPGLVISPVDFGEVSFEVVQVREYTLSVLDFTKHLSHKDIEESLRRNAKMHANEWWDTPDRYQALLSASNDLIDSAKALLSRYCEIKDEPKDPSEDAEMNAIRKKFYYSANTLYRIKCELMNRIASEKSPIMQKELSKIYAELEAIHSNTLQKIAVEVGKVETNIREEHATSRIFPMIFGERNIKKQIALSLGKARAILGSDGPTQ